MAREVKLENGYVCMAISSKEDPSKAMLLNKEQYESFLAQQAA